MNFSTLTHNPLVAAVGGAVAGALAVVLLGNPINRLLQRDEYEISSQYCGPDTYQTLTIMNERTKAQVTKMAKNVNVMHIHIENTDEKALTDGAIYVQLVPWFEEYKILYYYFSANSAVLAADIKVKKEADSFWLEPKRMNKGDVLYLIIAVDLPVDTYLEANYPQLTFKTIGSPNCRFSVRAEPIGIFDKHISDVCKEGSNPTDGVSCEFGMFDSSIEPLDLQPGDRLVEIRQEHRKPRSAASMPPENGRGW